MGWLDHWDILLPAFLAGLLVLSTHIPLGKVVLKRGIIFLDLAVAQLAGLGLIIAHYTGMGTEDGHSHAEHSHASWWGEIINGLEHHWIEQLFACVVALLGVWVLQYFKTLSARVQEALIGIVFVLAATGGLLMLSNDPHGSERLKELLVGQILWVSYPQLILVSLLYATLFAIYMQLPRVWQQRLFYPLFALVITFSTQLVGVYLVFSSLIVPALVAMNSRKPFVVAWAVGVLGYSIGLVASSILDWPSGATVAWALAMVALLFYAVRQCLPQQASNTP